jgi:hypothetical protein
MSSNTTTATVETLTAEVRVLMVGSRQVTMSVYNQLDTVRFWQMTPFGRIRTRDQEHYEINLVGAHKETGVLVASRVVPPNLRGCGSYLSRDLGKAERDWAALDERDRQDVWAYLQSLPLIVLAGLR